MICECGIDQIVNEVSNRSESHSLAAAAANEDPNFFPASAKRHPKQFRGHSKRRRCLITVWVPPSPSPALSSILTTSTTGLITYGNV
ncbi:unnamed protein product [Caenorhabditis auriculariae]|uniref:Uncharacterized protein n=1 Tax=Caenorhabditis auriculariae TaxID=2777116 RepID=A0A8S1HRD1_9PELO|nr:unnamed protein product [Caenorhabditis auriculariae]